MKDEKRNRIPGFSCFMLHASSFILSLLVEVEIQMIVAAGLHFALKLRQLRIAVFVGNQRDRRRVVRRQRSRQGGDGDAVPAGGCAGSVAGVDEVRAVLLNFAEGDFAALAASGV